MNEQQLREQIQNIFDEELYIEVIGAEPFQQTNICNQDEAISRIIDLIKNGS
jgi:hypothetical protein